MYRPGHKSHSLPPYCPYLVTSNISPNIKVNTNYNGYCSEKEVFPTTHWQIYQINKAIHTTKSSSEWRRVQHQSRMSRIASGIAQLAIKRAACSRDTTRNEYLRQWRVREFDRGLSWERNCWGNKASWRHRGSNYSGAGRYGNSWKRVVDHQTARKNIAWSNGCYRR